MTIAATSSLLSSLSGASWDAGHLVLASGQSRWLRVQTAGTSSTWVLDGPGTNAYTISEADAGRLIGGTALSDGGFRDATGAAWFLEPKPGSIAACEPDPAPPEG